MAIDIHQSPQGGRHFRSLWAKCFPFPKNLFALLRWWRRRKKVHCVSGSFHIEEKQTAGLSSCQTAPADLKTPSALASFFGPLSTVKEYRRKIHKALKVPDTHQKTFGTWLRRSSHSANSQAERGEKITIKTHPSWWNSTLLTCWPTHNPSTLITLMNWVCLPYITSTDRFLSLSLQSTFFSILPWWN